MSNSDNFFKRWWAVCLFILIAAFFGTPSVGEAVTYVLSIAAMTIFGFAAIVVWAIIISPKFSDKKNLRSEESSDILSKVKEQKEKEKNNGNI